MTYQCTGVLHTPFATDDDAPADDDDLPCVPSMDMLQDFYNTGHSYPGDDPGDDDEAPSWD